MADFPPDGPGDGVGSQPGEQGPGTQAQGEFSEGIVIHHDADDTQPFRGPEDHHNRLYIPARWKPRGMGGGSPKIDGGIEVDKRTGAVVGRGLNRTNQRYSLPQSEIQARRRATADANYSASVILFGEEDQYEVRSPSGNNYDVSANLVTCDCPDFWRQDASGYGIVRCNHIYMVIRALADPVYIDGLPWSCGRVAWLLGTSERMVEQHCEDGDILATKVHNVWVIEAPIAAAFVTIYGARIWPYG